MGGSKKCVGVRYGWEQAMGGSFDHSMPWLLITLGGGSEHTFWSFYNMAFDYFGGWIGACFLIILCYGF